MSATITLEDLKQLTSANYHIIDIRSPHEYASHHLSQAVNVPYDLLMMYPESYLKKDETYYLICAHGSLSLRACAILQAYGYNTASIKNGYQAQMRCCYY